MKKNDSHVYKSRKVGNIVGYSFDWLNLARHYKPKV